MKRLKLFFACLLMAVLSIGQVWADDPEQIASGTFDGKNETYTTGWSTTGTGKGRNDCIIIGSGENITSPSIDLSQYESITISIKARRYGTISNPNKATIAVAFGGESIGSVDATGTSATTSLENIEHTVIAATSKTSTFVFTCSNASSAGSTHGAGINTITITGIKKSGGCTNTVTVAKVTPAHGDFDLSATEVCGEGAGGEVSITNIEPATGYELDDITATVGTVDKVNKKVTGITANTSIAVTFKELPKYIVTLMDDTEHPLVEASAGAGVTLPSRDGCTGYTFAGWTKDWTTAQTTWTTTAPTVIEEGSYLPTTNVSLYPVYTKAEGTAESWNLVTSEPSDWSGDYVIVNPAKTYAMSSDFYSGTSGEFVGVSVTIANDKVTSDVSNKMIWTFAKNGSEAQYSIKNKATGTYAKITGTSGANAALDESVVWFTIESNSTDYVWDLASVDKSARCFSYYTTNTSFRTYAKSSNNTGYLYKKSGGQTVSYISEPNCTTPVVIVKTLKSIAVSGMTINYETGNTFSFDGTCTATYSVTVDDEPQDDEEQIVDPTEVTSPDMSTAGVKSITVSFTDGDVTKTDSYDITVVKAPDVVLDFTDNTEWQFPTDKTQGEAQYSDGTYTITVFGPSANKEGYNFNTSGGSNKLILGKTGAYIVLPEFANPIAKIVCPGVDGASSGVKWNVFDGETAVSTEAEGCTADRTFMIENPEENKTYTIKVTSSANLQISHIKIYYGEAPAVKKPSIVGNAAFVGSQDVTITCGTEGAAIYYTTDATKKDDPSTETWTAYDTKVTIDESCTLYAAATKGTDWSAVASKAFTATPLYNSIEALQGVATNDETTVFVQMTDWIVTAVSGNNTYVTDGSGKGVVFFKYGGADFAIGDKLNKAQLEATLQNYNGTYELKNLTTANFAGEGELVHNAEITPIAKTATEYAALTNANQGALFVVNSLTFDEANHKFVDDDANEIAYYNKFSIEEEDLVDGHKYNVTGVAVYYAGGETPVVQLCPRAASDLVDNTTYVQISFNANTEAAYTGTLPTTVTDLISGADYTIPATSLARTDGFYQLGWNTDKDATVALTTLTNVTANQVLYAIWKETDNCTITFYSKGVVHDTKVVAQNAAYNFSDVTAPSAQGYTFAGWSETEIATEEASANILDSYTPTSTTKNLYAVFSRKVDGETTTQYEKVTVAPASWAGNYLLVYENSATDGYVWDGTDANPNYKTATIATGVIETKPADAALLTIAAYSTGHSILINGGVNDGKYLNGNGKNTGLLFGDNADVVTISCKTNGTELLFTQRSIRYMDGRFRFYADDKDLAWLYRENTVTPQSDVYTTNPATRYTISFVLATGESGSFNAISVVEGEDATLPTAVPTKLHNTFLKWSDGVNEYEAGATITNVQADIELHATWTEKAHATVSYNLNGATGSIDPVEVYAGETYYLEDAPVWGENIFKGWSDGTEVHNAGKQMTMDETPEAIEYVAQWTAFLPIPASVPAFDNGVWVKESDEANLAAGDYVMVVALDYEVALGTTQNNNNRSESEIIKIATTTDSVLTYETAPAFLFLQNGLANGHYGLYGMNGANGYLYAATKGSNHLRTQASMDVNSSWKIEITDGVASIVAENSINNNVMLNNANSSIFSCYTGTSSTVKDVTIYRFQEGKNLYKVDYKVGEDIVKTVYTITDKITVEAIGENVSWSNGDNKYFPGDEIDVTANMVLTYVEPEVIRTTGVTPGVMGTICPKQEIKYPTGASFYTMSYVEKHGGEPYKVFYDEIAEGESLQAGHPYLFIADEESNAIKGIKAGDEATSAINDHGFVGVLENETISVAAADVNDYRYYIIYNNEIRLCGEGNFLIRGERAYLDLDSDDVVTVSKAPIAGRRRVALGTSGTNAATGIDELNASDKPVKMIIDGQLFIIRGEKMFNANGQLVK